MGLSTAVRRWSNGPIIRPVKVAVRAFQQEHKAAAELESYRAKAKQMGINVPSPEQLPGLLARRLGTRRKAPKRKGDLHIFLAYRVSNWERVLPLALRPFGDVTEFDWRTYGFDDRRADWMGQRDHMNRTMLEVFHKANAAHPVDAVVGYLGGHYVDSAVVRKMGESGAVVFNFSWDDKLTFRGPKRNGYSAGPAALASAVDLNLTNASDSCVKYMVEGGLAMFWPEAAEPSFHRPYDLPFEYDVSFVGANYGWRPRFIRRLKQLGIEVQCFGFGWPNGTLSDEETVKMYSLSRVNLGFAGVGYSKKLTCLKARDFEVPMSGGLYLTQDNPELALVYDVGDEIVTYSDERDCARKIRSLLMDHKRAQEIRTAGRKRAIADHTWTKRFEQVFRMADLLQNVGSRRMNQSLSDVTSNMEKSDDHILLEERGSQQCLP